MKSALFTNNVKTIVDSNWQFNSKCILVTSFWF